MGCSSMFRRDRAAILVPRPAAPSLMFRMPLRFRRRSYLMIVAFRKSEPGG